MNYWWVWEREVHKVQNANSVTQVNNKQVESGWSSQDNHADCNFMKNDNNFNYDIHYII